MSDTSLPNLADLWMRDQSVSFAATLLGDAPTSEHLPQACAEIVVENLASIRGGLVSDSTLSLIRTINGVYRERSALEHDGYTGLAPLAVDLALAIDEADRELARRESGADNYLNRVLVSHAAYVLKRPHISALKFFKWLNRSSRKAVPGLDLVLNKIDAAAGTLAPRLDDALSTSRNPDLQTRDRLDAIDDLFELVLEASGKRAGEVLHWWARVCIGYRSSLFCWPLLAFELGTTNRKEDEPDARPAGEQRDPDDSRRGISLPIALFLYPDGQSSHRADRNDRGQKRWFKHVFSKRRRQSSEEPKYVPPNGEIPAHMGESHFGWDTGWADSFCVGTDVAKKLWATQNGRLRYANEEVANRLLTASLNVDLAAACDIVDSVYCRVPTTLWDLLAPEEAYFTVSDRSAEAYWVQCVLGLLLPAREQPLGVCTGRIEYVRGEYEIHDVEGVVAKLEYANRAGVPRVVLPGDRTEYVDEDEVPEIKADAKEFLDRIAAEKSRKTMEMNFCRTARAAADAMQPSGWRRTMFVRLPGLQRPFSHHQRRLFLRDALSDRETKHQLKPREVAWYRDRKEWRDFETADLTRLDDLFLSGADRSVKYVFRSQILRVFKNVEEAVGKWLAWKDNEVRSGAATGYRGPGLGILALRTNQHDNEMRLWAALAELLEVDEDWWDRFQWAGLEQSAGMLAQLLGNQRADIAISAGSAPDLLIIFDDGNLTQRRINRVFPNHFHHHFFDLLNPRHPENRKHDFLDDAMKKLGQGSLGHPTRIIVIVGEGDDEDRSIHGKVEIDDADRRVLERLAVFRFGSARQAAFSMMNYAVGNEARFSWLEAQETIERLLDRNLLRRSRNIVFVPDAVRLQLAGNELENDPGAHQHAARALCPILLPSGVFISANRDRQLEPEAVIEASWHLQRAYSLVPYRFAQSDRSVSDAQALLTLLRTSPDWDTVKQLRVNRLAGGDAVDLGRELMEQQTKLSGEQPSVARIGLMVETIGRLCKNQRPAEAAAKGFADEICELVESAVDRMPEPASAQDARYRRRALRFIFSRQIYAMRMLEVPLSDARLAGARSYTENSVSEALGESFLDELGDEYEGLDDFPLSHDYWMCMWKDEKRKTEHEPLTTRQRSTYAYAAARTNLGRTRNGDVLRSPWDQPWISYFALTKVGEIDRNQIKDPLATWNTVYGQTPEEATAFGRRVLDLNRHAVAKKGGWEPLWLSEINAAVANIWEFVADPDPKIRLFGQPVGHALKLLRVIALQETLPAFCFMRNCHWSWTVGWATIAQGETHRWPVIAQTEDAEIAEAWKSLARDIVGSSAGWANMLASLANLPDDQKRLSCVRSWLFALEETGRAELHQSDPEDLVRSGRISIAKEYLASVEQSVGSANGVLTLRNEKGWQLYGGLRQRLYGVPSELRTQTRY